jgi:hypothetical protein
MKTLQHDYRETKI